MSNDIFLNPISAFGIELKKLREKDLPLLCQWRNHPSIRPFMEDTRELTLRHLGYWLNKAEKSAKSFQYLAYLKDRPIAYTEIKDIDYNHSSATDGLFVFGPEIAGTGLSYNIVLCREILVERLRLKDLFSIVHMANAGGNGFVKNYGGELIGQKGDFNIYKHFFLKRRSRLKQIASFLRMSGEYEKNFGSGGIITSIACTHGE